MDKEKLIEIAKPYFDTCRAGDWNHALRVVEWVKKLGKDREDIDLIITAAYLHDIGWSGVIKEGLVDFDEMVKLEPKANQNTPIFVREVMEKLDFNDEDIKTVIRLIDAADKRRSDKDDEAIIVDSDNLSKLNLDHLQEKYKPDSFQKVIDTWDEELPVRIKTEEGKRLWKGLLDNLKEELSKNGI